jgi:archaellum component FlaC
MTRYDIVYDKAADNSYMEVRIDGGYVLWKEAAREIKRLRAEVKRWEIAYEERDQDFWALQERQPQ